MSTEKKLSCNDKIDTKDLLIKEYQKTIKELLNKNKELEKKLSKLK